MPEMIIVVIFKEIQIGIGDLSYFFRPFQSEVLKYCLKNYDVAIWTSNVTDKYIRQVLEKLNMNSCGICAIFICKQNSKQYNFMRKD